MFAAVALAVLVAAQTADVEEPVDTVLAVDDERDDEHDERDDRDDRDDDRDNDRDDKKKPAMFTSRTQLHLGGRLGVAAGNIGVIPFFLPGPGAFLQGSERVALWNTAFFAVDGGLALGINNQSDSTSIAGYKLRGAFGLRLSPTPNLAFDFDAHAGVTSIVLLPLPRAGLGATVSFNKPVGAGVAIDGGATIDLDLLVIAPAPGFSANLGATWTYGPVFAGVHAGVDGDAIIAVVVNTVSASGFVRATMGCSF
jgi:hypothetical protein